MSVLVAQPLPTSREVSVDGFFTLRLEPYSCAWSAGERHGLLQQRCTDSTARDSGIAKAGENPVLPARVQRWRILPRSRHRPVASTDGSITKNFNEIGVRLWT